MDDAPLVVSREQFEQFVDEALRGIPEELSRQLNNVDVVIEEWPDRQTMREAGVRHPTQLLGFYHGVPLSERTSGYYLVLPDKISIYRQPILLQCDTLDEVHDLVQRVVHHEIAHHFGLDDEWLVNIGAY